MENQITTNFTLNELIYSSTADRYDIDNTPSQFEYDNLKRLCEKVLQPIRDKYGEPIKVTSGYRSPQLNIRLKGASSSAHLKGLAADIDTPNNEKLFNIIISMMHKGEIDVDQLIDESNYSWIHIGIKPDSKDNRNQILHL